MPAPAAAATLVPWLVLGERFPDPVAVRWRMSGEPNGPMSIAFHLLVVVGGMALAWLALFLVLAGRCRLHP